jgi:hypothetical protein
LAAVFWIPAFSGLFGLLRERMPRFANNSEEFRVRQKIAIHKGSRQTEWVAMRKGVAWLFRYRASLMANSRYLDALAVVDEPTNATRDLDRVTTRKKYAAGPGCSGFNPVARHDAE